MNEKKLLSEKKLSKKGLLEFLDKKAFYIVLILCIAIVGVTAVIISTNSTTSSNSGFDAKIIPEASGNDLKADAGEKAVPSKAAQSSIATPASSTGEKAGESSKNTVTGTNSNIALNDAKKGEKPQ